MKKTAKKTTTKKSTLKSSKSIAVLVTTEFRGVFYGHTTNPCADPIELTGARNCLYWSSDVGGFLGLTERGPSAQCRIGAPNPGVTRLSKVTCVSDLSPIAAKAWSDASVYRG